MEVSIVANENNPVSDGEPKARSAWNSLEIAKLLVSTSTTIAIFVVGYVLQRQQAELSYIRSKEDRENAQATQRHEKFLNKRVELWDKIGPIYAQINLLADNPNLNKIMQEEIRTLQKQTNWLVITYQLYFSRDFVDKIEWYDDIVDGRLKGEPTNQRNLWDAYKAIRRVVARDIAMDVDSRLLELEGVSVLAPKN